MSVPVPGWVVSLAALLSHSTCMGQDFDDDFEAGLDAWMPLSAAHATIVTEPGADNRVLQLTPRHQNYSHALLNAEIPEGAVRMEGRFLFPTEGDGYLGFIYNYRQSEERSDFGCLYVKSNGNYVRISPHHDGNPSWRLYEESKVSLSGDRSIETGRWYRFRLDVYGSSAALYINDFGHPVVVFDGAPTASGRLGLEARPGRGEPVWVDDVRVTGLEAPVQGARNSKPAAALTGWQFQPATTDPMDSELARPVLPDQAWRDLETDDRGAVITGRLTQYASGEHSVVYLRAFLFVPEGRENGWLALSTANRVDAWSGEAYLGTAAPQEYIWSDHRDNPAHVGPRLPFSVEPGRREIILRVYGDRFAGGGFFADVVYP